VFFVVNHGILAEKAQTLFPFLDEVVTEGLIAIEAVRVLKYRHNQDNARPQAK
jgi:hypothetical protein